MGAIEDPDGTVRITKVQDAGDHVTANLTVRYGSWQTDVGDGVTREVLPPYAARLSARTRPRRGQAVMA